MTFSKTSILTDTAIFKTISLSFTEMVAVWQPLEHLFIKQPQLNPKSSDWTHKINFKVMATVILDLPMNGCS